MHGATSPQVLSPCSVTHSAQHTAALGCGGKQHHNNTRQPPALRHLPPLRPPCRSGNPRRSSAYEHGAHASTRGCRGPDEVDGVPAVRFLLSMVTSFVYAVAAFGVVPVVFSDAVNDVSFRSKASLAGILLVATNGVAVCVLLDMYRYYDLWPHKAAQIVLQVRCVS